MSSAAGPHQYDAPHLARNAANFAALTPLSFLARAASIYPDKLAVVHGEARFTYREFYGRCRRLRRRAAPARHPAGGHGRGDGAERAGLARSALRRADGGGRAERAQLPARRALDRLHPRPWRGQAADRRPRIRPRSSARRSRAAAGRCRSSRSPTCPAATRSAAPITRIFSPRATRRALERPATTNGRRSRSTIPRAPPATPRASSITTAAPF